MRKKRNWINHVFNFLAVILGVYLAFFMNERANTKKDRREAEVIMKSLINDLSQDINVYEEYQIPENLQHKENIAFLTREVSKENNSMFLKSLSLVFQVENFSPSSSTYNSMKSSGKLGLINDLSLQKELNDYYEGLAVESVKKGEFQVEYFTNEILPWLTTNVDLSDMSLLKEGELKEFRNKLIVYESLIDQKLENYQAIVSDSKKLKQKIEAALGTK